MHTDKRGLALTAGNESAIDLYNQTIDDYFAYRLSAGAVIKQALEADPEFAMAHCFRGYLFLQFASNIFVPRAKEHLSAGQARRGEVTPREQRHIDALEAWTDGDLHRACAVWEDILATDPLDLVALRLHHYNSFWMGRNTAMRDAVASVRPAWDESIPGFANLLGIYAFALEETNEYAKAEELGRQAVALDGDDLWAIHSVAHVLEMQGRLDDGIAWLDYPADTWDDRNPFRGHLWWHRALFMLERGEYDQVLALYDASVRSGAGAFYLDRQNMVALLARLEFQGCDVGDRWNELADEAENHINDHPMGFTDTHTMVALAATERWDKADALIASQTAAATTPNDYASAIMNAVTTPICRGLQAYARRDYETAIETLLPLRHDWQPIGASHAQRDLFAQTLIEATLKAGRGDLAVSLLSERVELRPHSAGNWRKYIEALGLAGQSERLEKAREQAAALGY